MGPSLTTQQQIQFANFYPFLPQPGFVFGVMPHRLFVSRQCLHQREKIRKFVAIDLYLRAVLDTAGQLCGDGTGIKSILRFANIEPLGNRGISGVKTVIKRLYKATDDGKCIDVLKPTRIS